MNLLTHGPNRLIEDVLMLFANGTLRPSRETKFFAIEQVQDSFRYLQAGKHIGKSVIKVDKSVDPALVAYQLSLRLSIHY